MKADEIKAHLKVKGITQGSLSRKWKAPKSTVGNLINKRFTSLRLEKKLAKAIGVTLEQLRNGQ